MTLVNIYVVYLNIYVVYLKVGGIPILANGSWIAKLSDINQLILSNCAVTKRTVL